MVINGESGLHAPLIGLTKRVDRTGRNIPILIMKPSEIALSNLPDPDQPLWDALGGAWRAQEKLDNDGHGTGQIEFRPLNHRAASTCSDDGGEPRPDPDADLSFEKPDFLEDRGSFRLA